MDHFSQLVPHGVCLLWNPSLIALVILGNLAVFSAYMEIPRAFYAAWRAGELHLNHASREFLIKFAAFIFFCGGGHLLLVIQLWFPIYWFEASWTVAGTATTSWLAVRMVSKNMKAYIPLLGEPVRWDEMRKELEQIRQQLKDKEDER